MRLAEGQADDVSWPVSLDKRGAESRVKFAVERRADVGQVPDDAALVGKVVDGLLMRLAEGQADDVSWPVVSDKRSAESRVEFAV